MNSGINEPVPDLVACWILAKVIVTLPIRRRPDRSRSESAAAVRAHILQNGIDTGDAKRALVAANARLQRVRRQRLVAVLTGRSEFKHSTSLSATDKRPLSTSDNECAQRDVGPTAELLLLLCIAHLG